MLPELIAANLDNSSTRCAAVCFRSGIYFLFINQGLAQIVDRYNPSSFHIKRTMGRRSTNPDVR